MTAHPNVHALATVYWLREEEGGRKAIPAGPLFIAPASVTGPAGACEASWSLILRMDGPVDENRNQKVSITFLVEEAPAYLLVKGATFKMFEGARQFLKGSVTES